MVSLDRTLQAQHDLDWLPPSFKAIRWSVAGTLWTGLAGLLGGAFFVAKPGFFIYGKAIAVLFAGGYYAGDRAARAVLRGRLAKLAHGQVDVRRLQREADGELVHVRGRIKAISTIEPVTHPELLDSVVYRRVVFSIDAKRWVHEAGCDFYLVDGTGERALIDVSEARLIAPDPKRVRVQGELASLVTNLPLRPELRGRGTVEGGLRVNVRNVVAAGERVLTDGDEVEVVGYKSRTVDPTVEARLERDIPMRATLRSGKLLPLLISPVRV